MVENGFIGGARPLPPHEFQNEPHDQFLELCAIATTGSLSAEERRRLEGHLKDCAACREALSQYEAIIGGAIPAMAPEPSLLKDREQITAWSPDLTEAKLFARLKEDEERVERALTGASAPTRPSDSSGENLWRHVWWQFAAGLLLSVAFGTSLYKVGIRRGVASARLAPPTMPAMQPSGPARTEQTAAGPVPANELTSKKDAQVGILQEQLEERAAEIVKLKAQQAQMAKNLDDKDADRVRLAEERVQAARQLQMAQADLLTVQQKLDAATSAHSAEVARAETLDTKVNQLTDTLQGRDKELAREQELLDHDRDIRELMGSRDLYIAEVYDVAKTGDTQKAFGRVFYTKAKSLIFYAYDLDQQAGIKSASTFQAWGRRGPDREQAVNLGILFQDNASKQRWVLKSNNAKTLAEIDAVFVTVEPNGGSHHPSGKPLLFAYLKVDPNHP
jgi:hypothetical protein